MNLLLLLLLLGTLIPCCLPPAATSSPRRLPGQTSQTPLLTGCICQDVVLVDQAQGFDQPQATFD
jgi:hypothetical protein